MSSDDTEPTRSDLDTDKPSSPQLSVRQISDARTLRALAHPVRIALIEALGLGGAMTATQVGEEIGESPTTCSFHLRQLAKYGFVEEAGGGKGRSRPWRITTFGMSFASTSDDPEYEVAALALTRMVRERQLDRFRQWLEASASFPREWRDAAGSSEYVIYLKPDELEQLNDELARVLTSRYVERLMDPAERPPGSVPVEFLQLSYPIQLPQPSDDDDGDSAPAPGETS
jgi:DNA-binding transcriptional ArsR family regulator